MGQAKQRGTFEERKALAIRKREDEIRETREKEDREYEERRKKREEWWNSLSQEEQEEEKRKARMRQQNRTQAFMFVGAAFCLVLSSGYRGKIR